MEKILAKLLRNLINDGVKRVEYETKEFKIIAYTVPSGKTNIYRIDLKKNML